MLRTEDFQVVVADHNMPGTTGISLCEELGANRPDLPVVVITAFGSMETAIAAIRAGAYDFLPKPFETEQLVLTLERAIAHRALEQEVKRLRQAMAESARFGDILGESSAIRTVHDLIARAAGSEATVLVTGESGTGKDLVARALHERSPRGRAPSWPSTAPRSPSRCWRASCSVTCGAPSPTRARIAPGLLIQAQGGPSFSTRLATCR